MVPGGGVEGCGKRATRRGHHDVRSRVAASGVALAIAVVLMAEAQVDARHTGAGIARRVAFHERQRAERAEIEAAGGAEVPAEVEGVASVSATDVLDGVAEAGPNYTLLKSKETKKARRKRQREQAAVVQAQAAADADDTDVAAVEGEVNAVGSVSSQLLADQLLVIK